MFRYAKTLLATLALLAAVGGCSSMNSCGGGGSSCGYGGCDSCGGGGCDSCGGGCNSCGGSDYSAWYPWNWFGHGGEEWMGCSSCGEAYWGDHDSDCSPCDQCGNYVGYGQPAVGYQQPSMGDDYAARSPSGGYMTGAYANNRARPMPYPPQNAPVMARQPRMLPAQPQYDEQGPQFADEQPPTPQYAPPQYAPPRYLPQPRYAPQPAYAAQRYAQPQYNQQPQYAQQAYPRQPQYMQRPLPVPQPRSVRTYARPEDQFSARAGSRESGDPSSVSANLRPRTPNGYHEMAASGEQPVSPSDNQRVNRVRYDERAAPQSQQPVPPRLTDPAAGIRTE